MIGVDGGARAAAALGLALDLIVGDFDTLRADEVDALEAQGVRVLRSPHDKDATDTELALIAACDAGAVRAEILGALGASGGRSDHSLGTIALLAHPRARAIDCSLLDATSRTRLLTAPARFASDCAAGAVLSLIPWGGRRARQHGTTALAAAARTTARREHARTLQREPWRAVHRGA